MAGMRQTARGRVCSLRRLLLFLGAEIASWSSVGPAAAASDSSQIRKAFQCAARGILLGVFLGASHAAGQRRSRLCVIAFEPDLDQKTLVVVGAALALDAIHRHSRARGLQPLLKRGFVVAQSGAGAQLDEPVARRPRPSPGCGQTLAQGPGRHRETARPSLLPWYWKVPCSCGAGRCALRRCSGADACRGRSLRPPAPCAAG